MTYGKTLPRTAQKHDGQETTNMIPEPPLWLPRKRTTPSGTRSQHVFDIARGGSEAVFFPALARYTRAYNGSLRGANSERPVLGELFVAAPSREISMEFAGFEATVGK
jgi:hypothetical protein